MATNHELIQAPTELPSGAVHQVPSARLNKPYGRPDVTAIGVIVWLASELMFFGAIFAAYFWTRSYAIDAAVAAGTPSMWDTESAHLDIVFASINTSILVLSSITIQLGANAAEAGRVNGSWFNPLKWGVRQGFIISAILGSIFLAGQVWEYFTLFNEGFVISTNQYWSLFFIATGIGQTPATIVYSYVGGMLTGGAKLLMIGLLCLFSLAILASIIRQIYTDLQKKKANG